MIKHEKEKTGLLVRFTAYVLIPTITILLSAIIFEIFARVFIDDGMHFDLEMWKYAKEIKRESSISGLGHEHRENSSAKLMGVDVAINSIGLRDREFGPKSASTTRILMLGDSLTFGWGVKSEDTPSKLLEYELNKKHRNGGKDYEVINSGVGNYNTSQELIYFKSKGYKLNPDIVVLNYFINDAEPTPKKKTGFINNFSYAYVVGLGVADILKRKYLGGSDWRDYYSNLYKKDSVSWIKTQNSISELARICKQKKIKLLVVNYPELHELKEYPFNDVTDAVRKIAENNNVYFLDLLPSVQDRQPMSLWVSPTDAHPNRVANKIYSKVINEKLAEIANK